MSIREEAGSGWGVLLCVEKMPEATARSGNISAVPDNKENIKTDFFIISPRDS